MKLHRGTVEQESDSTAGASKLRAPVRGAAHILSLDGFRGLAVLAVIAFHYLPRTGLGPLGLLASLGWTGVDGFLVLSGFLITGILYRQRGAPGYFRNFYTRRALRLFPLYYSVLLLAFVVSLFAGHPWRVGHLGFVFYSANAMLSHDQSLGDLGIFNMRHFWTLALEEQFYLLWPWVVGSRLSRKALLLVCASGIGIAIACRILLYVAHASLWIEYYSLPTRMDSLLIGAAIALMPLPGKTFARWGLGVAALSYACLALSAGNSFFTATPIVLAGYTVLGVLYGSLLVLALHSGTLASRLLSVAPLRFLGKLSYGLYLWHYLFSQQAEKLTEWIQARVYPQALGSVAAFAVMLSLSIAIAMASYRWIERPFLKLKDRFEPAAKPPEAA